MHIRENLRTPKALEKLQQHIAAIKSASDISLDMVDFKTVFFVNTFESLLQSGYRECTFNSATGPDDVFELARSYAKSDPLPFSSLAPQYQDFNDCVSHAYQAMLRDLE
jgi:hypothetical protein